MTAFSSSCEQMIMKPAHIDGGVLDLLMSVAWDGSPVETSDHSVIFIHCVPEIYENRFFLF